MASEQARLHRCVQSRRSTINCLSKCVEDTKTLPFSQEKRVKAWSSLENLDPCTKTEKKLEWQQSISINVGGKVFHIPKHCAIKYPNTRIGSLVLCRDRTKLQTLCDDYSVCKNEFFFDRDPAFFHHVCHFYTSGVLWVIQEMCPINFEEELAYWGLNLKDTQRCCWIVFEEKVDELKDNLKVESELMAEIQIIFDAFTNTEDVNTQEDLRTMARVSNLGHVLKMVKLLRVFRILKLARHSTGMRAFGFTLRQCYQQASCIFLFIAMGIFTFSALLHSAERETEGSPISSIPYAWWWAAVSISTVGYGDVVPVTILGRVVAFGCISFGIILNGMPISFLFNKFSDYYAKLKSQECNATTVQRHFQLRKRLRHRMDLCFHPPDEDTRTTSICTD
ncbi:potassium voltage-gated channel subfamily V member 2-like isoform X2 [Solea solea]|uniref:potassium voltage-gated channel subfamily V member 2-like isoform X2 n=1 Tax=Solea solea TaxID=90069 RepID=UPI00272CDCCB|nr:potassium voltage-gated channel subfamily V member 2-like isoform X2 [Solea solea]